MGQNFRCYTNYSKKDINYYEKTHTSKASNNGRLYKNFVKWLFKIREIMKELKFDYKTIQRFEEKNDLNAIWSGRPTAAFLEYLDDRYQKRISDFL
jgi:hypothetical protein